MPKHLFASRPFLRRLRTRTASASSGIGVFVVSSVLRARTADVLALHCPLLRPPFSRLATTVNSRRLRLLNLPYSEQRNERQVGLGFAPEGAVLLRPLSLRRSFKVRGVAHGREKAIPLSSSAGASSQAAVVLSAHLGFSGRYRLGASGPSGAGFQPPWPNPRFEGTAGKRCLPVPRPLRGRAAPQAER
jgi:hypothetical protein